MNHFLLFVVFSFLNYAARAQVNDELAYRLGNHDKSFIKANKIETIKVNISFAGSSISRQHSFDSEGNMIYTATFNKKGQKVNESHFKFNRQGDKVYEKYSDLRNNTADSSFYERAYDGNKPIKESSEQAGYSTTYFYNSKGQLEKTLTNNNFGVATSTLYSYDSKGKEVELLWAQNNTRKITKNVYNTQGQLTEFEEHIYEAMDTVGKLFLHKRLQYATNGKLAREEYLDGYAGLDNDTIEYTYDRKGNLVLCKKGAEKRRFTYDSKGLLIKKETILADSFDNSVETYQYFFRNRRLD